MKNKGFLKKAMICVPVIICILICVGVAGTKYSKNKNTIKASGYSDSVESISSYLTDKYGKTFTLKDSSIAYDEDGENITTYYQFVDDSGTEFQVGYDNGKEKDECIVDTYADMFYRVELQNDLRRALKEVVGSDNIIVYAYDDNYFTKEHQEYKIKDLSDYTAVMHILNISIYTNDKETLDKVSASITEMLKMKYPDGLFMISGYSVNEDIFEELKKDLDQDTRVNMYIDEYTEGVTDFFDSIKPIGDFS